MALLQAGTSLSVIALWLGHESIETTQMYLHADMTMKQHALDRTTPPGVAPGRYRPKEQVLAFLESL
jgi:integrase